MKKYRVGIVGCGNIFPMHAVSIQNNPNLELVAVCDNKPDRVKAASEAFLCNAYTDYQEMLDLESLDVVHICTPHYLHAPMTIWAAQHNIHVLTEKPMAINVEDATKMIKACREHGVFLGVIFQNRYNNGAAFIKNTLESGALGKIKAAKMQVAWDRSDEYYSKSDWKGTWDKEGGGVVIDQAIHTLDLMRWFVGEPIDYIDANINNRVHKLIVVEDSAEGIIMFKNGVIGSFHVINFYTTDSPVTVELHCEHGFISYIGDVATIKYHNGKTEVVGPNQNEKFNYGNVKSYWGVSHVKQINEFYQSIQKDQKPIIDGEEALATQKIVNAIYDSGKTRQKIRF
jgi:predicted dehydrogenase